MAELSKAAVSCTFLSPTLCSGSKRLSCFVLLTSALEPCWMGVLTLCFLGVTVNFLLTLLRCMLPFRVQFLFRTDLLPNVYFVFSRSSNRGDVSSHRQLYTDSVWWTSANRLLWQHLLLCWWAANCLFSHAVVNMYFLYPVYSNCSCFSNVTSHRNSTKFMDECLKHMVFYFIHFEKRCKIWAQLKYTLAASNGPILSISRES